MATLATAQLFSGALPLIVEGSIYDLPDTFTWLSFKAKLFGFVPASALMMLIVAVLALLYMKYSRFAGRSTPWATTRHRAAGGHRREQGRDRLLRRRGLPLRRHRHHHRHRRPARDHHDGHGLEMTFIAAVVLGGTSTSGGSGTILGTIIGCAVLSVIAPAINYMGISSDWSDAIMGAIIIFAVVISEMQLCRSKRPAPDAERSAA